MPKFKPGQSGNPGGRPCGFAALVREKVNPQELIDRALEIVRGEQEVIPSERGNSVVIGPSAREQLAAMTFLADRGWGKPQQFINITDAPDDPAPNFDPTKLTTAELIELERLNEKATPSNDEAPARPGPDENA